MNEDKLEVGDLVTSSVRSVDGLGLVVKTVEGPAIYSYSDTGSGVAKVYWFKSGQVQLTWLHYLTKLEIQNE